MKNSQEFRQVDRHKHRSVCFQSSAFHCCYCFIVVYVSLLLLFHCCSCFIVAAVTSLLLFHCCYCFIVAYFSLLFLFNCCYCFIVVSVSLLLLFHWYFCFIVATISLLFLFHCCFYFIVVNRAKTAKSLGYHQLGNCELDLVHIHIILRITTIILAFQVKVFPYL